LCHCAQIMTQTRPSHYDALIFWWGQYTLVVLNSDIGYHYIIPCHFTFIYQDI